MTFGFPQIAELRLGYGLSPRFAPPQDVAGVLQSVHTVGAAPDAMTTESAGQIKLQLDALARAKKTGDPSAIQEHKVLSTQLSQMLVRNLQSRMVRAIDAPVGFGERVVQFWLDHFTVVPKSQTTFPLLAAFENEAIRPNVNGTFEDLFFAADTHPMMLIYLDQISSRGPNSAAGRKQPEKKFGVNENLAREAIELHSLGVGAAYVQNDIRQLAELMTGLSYNARKGFFFNPQIAEPGAEKVLGKSYGGTKKANLDEVRAAFHDIARRPEAAQFISRQLASHFISDTPSDGLVAAMVSAWRDTDGDLPTVYAAMVSHPDMTGQLRQKVRQPFDLLAAGYRALGVTGADLMDMDIRQFRQSASDALAQMGQPWARPRGPDGWAEEASSWIGPQMLAARINWSLRMPNLMLGGRMPDPRDFLLTALGGTHSEGLGWAVPKAESEAEGVALVLASADFNRR